MLIGKVIILIFIISCGLGRTYTRNQYDIIRSYFTRNKKLGFVNHMNDMFRLAKDLTTETNQKSLKYMQKKNKVTEMDTQLADFVGQLKPKTEFLGTVDLSDFAAGVYYDHLIDLYEDLKKWKKSSPFKNLAMTYANKIEIELISCGIPFNDEQQYQASEKEKKKINFVEKKKIGDKMHHGKTYASLGKYVKGKIATFLKVPSQIIGISGNAQEVKAKKENVEEVVKPDFVQIINDESQVHEEEFEDDKKNAEDNEDLERGENKPDFSADLKEDKIVKDSSEKNPSEEKVMTLPTIDAWYQEGPKITYEQTKEYDSKGNLISETPIVRTETNPNQKQTTFPQGKESSDFVQYPTIEPVSYMKLPEGREAWYHEKPKVTLKKTLSTNEKGEVINEGPIRIEESVQEPLKPLFDEIDQTEGNTNTLVLDTSKTESLVQPQKLKKIRRIIIIENVECKECTQDPIIRKFIGMNN